jgi:hypothetical protein
VNITLEMLEFFDARTRYHIQLVQKYAKLISEYERFRTLFSFMTHAFASSVKDHDQSKFVEPEKTPYVYITWRYHCKNFGIPFQSTPELEDSMHEATVHHVKNNRHHPEFFDENASISRKDRDKAPDKIVDASSMTDLDIAEMCADWMATGEERGNTARDWADKNVNKRWKFTKEQTQLIYDIINYVELSMSLEK